MPDQRSPKTLSYDYRLVQRLVQRLSSLDSVLFFFFCTCLFITYITHMSGIKQPSKRYEMLVLAEYIKRLNDYRLES